MTQENEIGQDQPIDVFEDVAIQEETREVEMPQTLSEAIDSPLDMTDMQYALAKSFPTETSVHDVMIARVDPGVFLSLLHLRSVNDIMKSDPKASIDVNAIYTKNYIELSIGLDGRGRIDIAEFAGAARMEKRATEGLKSLMSS